MRTWDFILTDQKWIEPLRSALREALQHSGHPELPIHTVVVDPQWPIVIRVGGESAAEHRFFCVEKGRIRDSAAQVTANPTLQWLEFEGADHLQKSLAQLVPQLCEPPPQRSLPLSPKTILWRLAAIVLLAVTVNVWLRFAGSQSQLPPLDWRKLAPDCVSLWVPAMVGWPALLLFALPSRRKIRRPLAWLAAPLLTTLIFGAIFFTKGRIVDGDSRIVLASGWSMLVEAGEPGKWLYDQYRFMRPRYASSPTIFPLISPWLVLLTSLAVTAIILRALPSLLPFKHKDLSGIRRGATPVRRGDQDPALDHR